MGVDIWERNFHDQVLGYCYANIVGTLKPQVKDNRKTTQTYINKLELRKCVHFGDTYIKIGTIQRRLAWPLRKDDTQIREAFQIFN